MATVHWTGGAADNNFGTAGNWSGGSAPAAGDNWIIDYGSDNITAGIDQTALTSGTGRVGPNFQGSIGTASSPLKTGGTFSKIVLNCPKASQVNIWPAACTDFVVLDCRSALLYDGNITRLALVNGDDITIGAASNPATVTLGTNRAAKQKLNVTIESGATIATITQLYGQVDNEAAFTTYNGIGGIFRHNGASTGAIATANLYNEKCSFVWRARSGNTGFTLGTLNNYGGTFDASETAWVNAITTLNYYGGTITLPETWTVTTMNIFAGGPSQYIGPQAGTINAYVVPGGH